MLNKIKWAYQRVVRGYDDRVYWQFDSYFLQVIPALEIFCKEQLKNKKRMEYNPVRRLVYLKTLELIKKHRKAGLKSINNEMTDELLGFIGMNATIYWD